MYYRCTLPHHRVRAPLALKSFCRHDRGQCSPAWTNPHADTSPYCHLGLLRPRLRAGILAHLLNVLVRLEVDRKDAWPELRNGRDVTREHAKVAGGGGDGDLVHLQREWEKAWLSARSPRDTPASIPKAALAFWPWNSMECGR